MRRKKANISIETIAFVVLTLLIIVIMGFVFKEQISNFTKRIFNIGEKYNTDTTKCLDNPSDPNSCQIFGTSPTK